MFLRMMPVALAALLLPISAPAQDPVPPPTPAAAAAVPTHTPSDAEVNAAALAFRTRVEAMNAEIAAAVEASGSNRRRATSRVEAILVRNQPDIDAFAAMLEAHFAARAAAASTEEARASTIQTGAAAVARIRGMPAQVRASLVPTRPAPGQPGEPAAPQAASRY